MTTVQYWQHKLNPEPPRAPRYIVINEERYAPVKNPLTGQVKLTQVPYVNSNKTWIDRLPPKKRKEVRGWQRLAKQLLDKPPESEV